MAGPSGSLVATGPGGYSPARATAAEMKKVVSGGVIRAVAFPLADAGLPDTIP